MEKRSINEYVWLGTSIRYILDVRPGQPIFGESAVEANIRELLRHIERSEFFVSLRLARGLEKMRISWVEESRREGDGEEWRATRVLTQDEFASLHAATQTLFDTVGAEAAGKVAFIASDGRYAVGRLMEDIGSLMAPGVYDSLPPLAQKDLAEAGRAIAFDLPTAAAFHILRATEAALRAFYVRIVKRDRIKEPRMWGPMVTSLRARRNAPPDVLLNNLDSLRAHFRNPTQHPEKTYEIDEVQDLFALAVDAMNRMSKHV